MSVVSKNNKYKKNIDEPRYWKTIYQMPTKMDTVCYFDMLQ